MRKLAVSTFLSLDGAPMVGVLTASGWAGEATTDIYGEGTDRRTSSLTAVPARGSAAADLPERSRQAKSERRFID